MNAQNSTKKTGDGTGWVYSDAVKDHFFRPQKAWCDGDDFEPDGEGTVGSPACGDMMKFYVKIDRENDRVADVRWRTFGCASAIASTSMLAVMLTENGGMPIDVALQIKPKDITARLGGLPTQKIHCSVLGDQALVAALHDYFKKSGQIYRTSTDEPKVICECGQITDREIADAVCAGADTFEKVRDTTNAAGVCGACEPEVREVIDRIKKEK